MANDPNAGLSTMLSFLQQGQSSGNDPLPQMPDYSQIRLPDPPQPLQRQGSGFGGVLKEIAGNTLGGLVNKYVGGKLQTHMDDQTAKEQGDALAPVIDEQIAGMDKNNPFRTALSSTRKLVTSGYPNTVKFGMKRYDDISKAIMVNSNPEMKNHLQVQNDEQGNSFYVDTATGGEAVPIMYKGKQLRNPQYSAPAISERTTASENPKIVQFTDAMGHPGFARQGDLTGAQPQGQPTQAQPSAQGPSVNNQGNIRPVGSNTGYQQFNTPEEGLAAIDKQIGIYGSKYGIDTLAGVFTKWAPPEDHNDTPALIANASKMLGIGPNDKIDLSNPATRAMLSAAIIRQESGNWKQPPSGPVRGQSPTERETATAQALLPIKRQEEIDKAQIDTEKQNIINQNKNVADLTKTSQQKQAAMNDPEKVKGRNNVTDMLTQLDGYYNELDKMNAIHNTDKGKASNMAASFNTSETGQKLGRSMGSKDQAVRDNINTIRTTLIPQIMKASGITGGMLNSDVELQNFLKSMTDTGQDISVAKAQIKRFDKIYGNGTIGNPKKESSDNKEPSHPGYTGREEMIGGVKYKLRNDGKWEK
jgi:hypothetical protein